jgi:hypothetical protein
LTLRNDYPDLEVAFINAGIVEIGPFAEREPSAIDREIDVDWRHFCLTRKQCLFCHQICRKHQNSDKLQIKSAFFAKLASRDEHLQSSARKK